MSELASLSRRINALLEDWNEGEPMPTMASLGTMLRFFCRHDLGPKLPWIGADSSGQYSVGWIVADRRLTLYCGSDGAIKAIFSRRQNGDIEVGTVETTAETVAADIPEWTAALFMREPAPA
mgnify:CR=1 FL=1